MILPSPSKSLAPTDPPIRMSQEELFRRVNRMRHDPTAGELVPFPMLDSAEAHPDWHCRIETDFKDAGIPHAQWSDAAILFLNGPVNLAMNQLREQRVEIGIDFWPWAEFNDTLLHVLTQKNPRPSAIRRLREDHPVAAAVAGAGLVIAGGAVVGPAMVIGGLNAVGFTSGGVAAGSLATGIQSMFYGGATSGIFSICQSIGATAVAPSVGAVISGLGSVLAGVGLIGGSQGEGKEDADDDNDDDDSSEPLVSV